MCLNVCVYGLTSVHESVFVCEYVYVCMCIFMCVCVRAFTLAYNDSNTNISIELLNLTP